MLDKKIRTKGSSVFLFHKDMTLVSCINATSKTKKKPVLVISSTHTDNKLTSTGKPKMIHDYNMSKGGVDVFDQMCAKYTVSRRTKRWSLCVFLE